MLFNVVKSPLDTRDFILESIIPEPISYPKKLNLWKGLSGVRDQGEQGSCSAQTAAAIKEWQEKLDVNYKGYFSPQFIYNNRPNQDSEGMTPRDTMKILQKIGIVPESEYRYGKIQKPEEIDPKLFESAKKYVIAGYAQVNTIDGLKKALYTSGPCYIAFPVYDTNRWDFWNPAEKGQVSIGGHAVTIVGWDTNGFIIRNSWGSSWNGSGWTMYPYSQFGMHWEIWTVIDDETGNPERKRDTNQIKRFLRRIYGCK
jgi:C1A family cysteine protease